uniref:Cadherin domain-containing protein n=1 Tax=Caenorhabditis japonica TaxID=281687 RepID=A0A8R1E152_CAEJA
MQDKNEHLTIDSLSGTVCIQKTFDYETTATFQTTVVATNSNSETSTSLISIRLLDVNDNWPIFYPNEYHLTIREGPTPSSEPLLVVSASDLDSGKFGDVTYQILSESASFNINPISGEIFAKKNLSKGRFHLVVSAKDGGGQTAENPANVHITVIDKSSKTPEFSSSKYEIKTTEDILPGIAIGSVAAISEARVKYSIYSGDPEHAFSIDEDTGKIYVTRYLDADIHDTVLLNVQATMDGGQTNQTQVLIRIEDHNDNSPVFSNSLVEISVREDQPSNEPFYVVHATDKDKKQNGAVKYSILSHHPTSSIEIDPSTGQIFFTTQSFDYESIRDYKLRIKASDGGIPSRSANMTLFVHITDVNDNAPRFEKSAYFMEVVENSPPKTTVGKVVAHDKDSSLNGQVKYRITNGSEYFGIDEKLGAIYTKRSLDREVISHVDVSVVAEDLGSPSLSGTTNVRVTILDVNDNPPSCHSITPIVVPANAPPSTSIGTIVATDPDKGLNGSVLYRAQLQSALFVIKANGDVYLRRSLNASEEYHQRLSVIVSDQGTPRKSTVCHVAVRVAKGSSSVVLIEPVQRFVQIPSTCRTNTTCRLIGFNATGVATWQIQSSDISNHFAIRDGVLSMTSLPSHRPPYSLVVILSDSNGRQKSVQMRIVATGEESMNKEETIRILDTTGIGAKIGRLGEKTSDIFYRFSSSNLSCPLELDQTGGILYLVEGIRARAQQDSNFSCFFEKFNTTDGSSDEMRVDLEISRSKSGKPIFDTDHITIKTREDTPTGTIITTVNATADDDSTTPISYRFTSQIDTFAIDQFTGDITLVENLHWHVKPIHQLVVEAFTNGIATTLLVTVHVEDVNDHSPFIVSQPTILLPSSFRKGAVVHRVVAIDLDHSDSLKYSVVSISELFKIDNSTGEVSILTSSDAEFPENLKTLKIRVEDVSDSTKFDEQEILIRGSKSNDSKSHWHFFDQQKSTVEVEPNTPKDTVVAVFPQGGASLRMIPTSSYFELRGSEVIVKGTGASSSQKFTILAENHSGEHDWTVLEILVPKTDENPPKIASTSCGVATIEENKEYGAFKRIMATGLTRESKFRFQGKTPLFTIHPTTGEISSKRLDRELTQEHLLVIILTDSGRNDSCTVRVQVADQNDNAPQFMATPIELTINESSRVGDVLHRFQASDMDIGLNGKFSFELIDDPSRSLDVVPETGALVIRRSVSMEEWTIKVRVFDGGAPSLSSEVSVKIDNRGGKSSKGGIASSELEFLRQSYVSSIDESLPRGQFVSKLELTTEDLAGTTYSIVEGNTDSAFSIDSDGVIRTNLELDKEIVDRYHLKVIAIGGKQQQASTRIDVRVNNLNDNQPSFPVLKPRRLSETLKVGSYVASVSAKDVDQIAPLEYFLEPDDTTFHVDRFTGVIHLASPLDYETRKEHTLRLRVTDGQFDTRTNLTIFVSDVNDNAPVFTKNFYATQVSPAAYSPETPFAIIEASDADSGPAGQVTYSLDESPMFRVSPTDGALFLKVLPPSGERYVVTVVATDGGVPAMRTSVPVSVLIGEIEPTEKPGFERNEFKFELLENTRIGMQIGNVSGENREFLYRIQDPDATKAFTIDRFGRLFVAGPIDRETRQFYEFTVEIDSEMTSFNRQKAQCKVHVVIMDENDNAPKFTSSVIHVSLKDTMTHGQTIGQLVADDVDSAENGRVSYRILTGNDYNIVTLNTDTGAIQFNEWNDAQLDEHLPNATWNILVEARDHGHPYKISVASVMVSLKLSSWSGSAPFFVLPAYEVHVLENTPIGTVVQKVRASNRLGMVDTGLLYSLKEHQGRLSIDVKSGELTLKTHLDWESEPLLTMYLSVSDGNGRSAVVPLKIHVEPVDEFAPVFTRPSYRIQIPTSTSVGDSVGQIQAIDEDGGPHGHVRYSISNQQDTLKIEEETGTLRLAKSLTSHRNLTHEQITVVAYSSPSKLVKTTVHLEIGPFETTPSIPRLLNSKPVQIAAASLILLLILLVIVICVCMCRAKNGASMEKPAPLQSRSSELEHPKSKSVKPSLQKQVYSVKTGEIRTLSSDIHHQLTNSMTSSASTSSDALRIIRGSSRSQMDSGIDPDTVSINSSVTDYLVSLGVNANPIPPRIRPNTTYDSLMNEYIYARVEDVLPPGPISLTTSNQHSLLRQPLSTGSIASRLPPIVPSFEPITEIFKETIEKRAEHHAHHPRKEYVQVEI